MGFTLVEILIVFLLGAGFVSLNQFFVLGTALTVLMKLGGSFLICFSFLMIYQTYKYPP